MSGRESAEHGELLSSGYQGVVFRTTVGAKPVIVKRAMGPALLRALRRAMIRREYRIYQRMQGVPGVPTCYGLDDNQDLLLEYVDGSSLRAVNNELADRERFFALLLEVIQRLHEVGVAHADMKRKENIIVTESGEPCLIDFGAAVLRRQSGGAINRFIFEQARRIDLNAWVKLKYRRRFEELSEADRPYYRPTISERLARFVRRFWRKLTARHWRKARRRSSR